MSQEDVPHSDHPLLSSNQNISRWSTMGKKYRTTNKCINSKAALLVLVLSFAMNLIYALLYQPANHNALLYLPNALFYEENDIPISVLFSYYVFLPIYEFNAILLCFYPLAGYLADIKFGRYKVLTKSLLFLIPSLICILFIGPTISVFLLFVNILFYLVLLVPLLCIGVFLFTTINVTFVTFNANIIQFGIDQLFDSPGDHQSIFIYWYFWTYYLASFISQLGWNMFYAIFSNRGSFSLLGIAILIISGTTAFIILIITSCIARRKEQWFLKDSARMNPYKLVYTISKFVRKHKVPIRRSAFTYCEDEVPSGLDLGKEKYGGPYTTEQVEDVKAFYGILRILLATGPLFFLEISINRIFLQTYKINSFDDHYDYDNSTYNYTSYRFDTCIYTCINNYTDYGCTKIHSVNEPASTLLHFGLLTSFLVAASIPAYLFLIRPFINYYKPRMLKYIGFGILLMLISIFCTFLMDFINIRDCFFYDRLSCHLNSSIYIVEGSLHAFSCVLVYPALYQFICAQSPHSMKGLLIGLAFAIKGIFQLLAILAVFIATVIRKNCYSCGIDYHILNIVVVIISLIGFICAAKKYKLRERDEPCHVRRYVEEYYSKIEQEENYDYSASTL